MYLGLVVLTHAQITHISLKPPRSDNVLNLKLILTDTAFAHVFLLTSDCSSFLTELQK